MFWLRNEGISQLHRYTYQEYVWLEAESTVRHEFLGGEIFAMVGGTPEHAAMGAQVIRQLGEQLSEGPCRVFTSDLGVRLMATGLAVVTKGSAALASIQCSLDVDAVWRAAREP